MRSLIMDLDGTLCDVSAYLHLGWPAFSVASVTIAPANPAMVTICQEADRDGVAVLIITGRGEDMRQETLDWLGDWGVPHHAAYFRKAGDHRYNALTKADLLAEAYADGWMPEVAYDDDPSVCAMWAKQGLDVVRVGTWDERLT